MIKSAISLIKKGIISDLNKLKFSKKVKFAPGTILLGKNEFAGGNFMDSNSIVINSIFGFASYIGHDTVIRRSKIGKYTCIGPNVSIVSGRHPVDKFVSVHPAFFSTAKQSGFSFVDHNIYEEDIYIENEYYVVIGNDVWIGDGAKIMAGVHIGDGAVIAAGALVNKSVEPYSIVGGIPAKVISRRFSEENQRCLLKFQWWNKDNNWLQDHIELFSDIDKFCDYIKDEEV